MDRIELRGELTSYGQGFLIWNTIRLGWILEVFITHKS